MTACERIEISRARLRAAMSPAPEPAAGSEPHDTGWLHRLKQMPTVALVLESFDAWWSGHPLRAAGQVAAQASSAIARPVAGRHPYALVLVAGVVGALLAWTRPWRWAFRPALLAGLAPQLVSRVVAKLPIESWMTLLGAALASPTLRANDSATGSTNGSTNDSPNRSANAAGAAGPAAASFESLAASP